MIYNTIDINTITVNWNIKLNYVSHFLWSNGFINMIRWDPRAINSMMHSQMKLIDIGWNN